MHRIDSSTKKANKFGAGKDGFTEGTPGVEAATETTDDWLDGVQEEIISPIEAMGYTPTKGTRNQLWTAMKRAQLLNGCSTWISRAQNTPLGGITYYLQDVVCDTTNKKWVIVGEADGVDAEIYLSDGTVASTGRSNGTTFVPVANPSNFDLKSIAYNGSNLFCAVGQKTGVNPYIVTSPDGNAPWTARTPTTPRNIDMFGVAYDGSSLWCAVGDIQGPNPYIITTTDPTANNWAEQVMVTPDATLLRSIDYGNGLWVAVGLVNAAATNPLIITSTNGTTWNTATPSVARSIPLYAVVYDAYHGKWIAGGNNIGGVGTPYILVSSDGSTWTEVTPPTRGDLRCLAASDNGIVVAGGAQADGETALLLVSADGGTTWVDVGFPTTVGGTDVDVWGAAYGNGQFIIVTSTDGTNNHIYASAQVLADLF